MKSCVGLTIDIHCHYSLTQRRWEVPSPFSFERDGDRPFASYASARQIARPLSRLGKLYFIGSRNCTGDELDRAFERRQLEHLTTFRQVDRVVLLALDEVHDETGRAYGPDAEEKSWQTDLYVSNGIIHALCEAHPERFLFGASIHPYREHAGRAAVELLDEVVDAGAVLIKWLPPTQNIEAGDPRTVAFLRRCATHRIPLLVHYGPEFTLGTRNPGAADPSTMLETLRMLRREGAMPTVIVAHLATPVLWPFTPAREYEMLVDALTGEFADAPLYADIAALASPAKIHWLRTVVRMPELWPKLVHGSDFPIPAMPLAVRDILGHRYRYVASQRNWIDRDIALKRGVGLPEEVFTRASTLLRFTS